MESYLENLSFGNYGSKIITLGESDTTNTYNVITILDDATITYKNLSNPAGQEDITSQLFFAGTTIYGKFKNISVASGTIMAYYSGSTQIK